MRRRRYGDPLRRQAVDMGPLINQGRRRQGQAAWSTARSAAGAQVVTGGKVADRGAGNYFEPTVLRRLHARTWTSMQQEIFGPVLPVRDVDGLDEAIELRQRLGLRADLVDLHDRHQRPRCAPATSCGSARPTSTARISRRCRASTPAHGQLGHRRRRRQARALRVHADARRLHPDTGLTRTAVRRIPVRQSCRGVSTAGRRHRDE